MLQNLEDTKNNTNESRSFLRTKMQKESIIQKLKEQGCRITKQRLMLLNIILEEECTCCKEIYYKASKIDKKIGFSTVYRIINTLEEMGAIKRINIYKIVCEEECEMEDACTIEFENNDVIELSSKKWSEVIQKGLEACGYANIQNIRSVIVKPCECEE